MSLNAVQVAVRETWLVEMGDLRGVATQLVMTVEESHDQSLEDCLLHGHFAVVRS